MTTRNERLEELLVDHALSGLAVGELRELSDLEGGSIESDSHDDRYELAAAEAELALIEHDIAVPSGVVDRLHASISESLGTAQPDLKLSGLDPRPAPDAAQHDAAPSLRFPVVPWLAAAAAIVLAAFAWLPSASPSLAEQRQALIDSGRDIVTVAWQALDDVSAAEFVEGEVVWSGDAQEGYMRFVGLKPNDPSAEQYQLWIFDSTRPDAHPVDGGVFDVNSDGEVIIQIDPKIEVRDAAMFAITVEPPGGVVVSDRSRLPLLAQLSG